MPNGSTPGPFHRDGNVISRNYGDIPCLMADVLDEGERDILVDLLNKGTHFDNLRSAMLESQSGQYSRADANRILRSALNAIDNAEGKDDG